MFAVDLVPERLALAAALLVANFGYGSAYTVDAILFLFGLWALFKLPEMLPESLRSQNEQDKQNSTGSARQSVPRKRVGLASVLDGLRYLHTQPNVRMTFLVDIAAMVLAMPRVLFPAIGFIVLGGGATTVGVLTAAFAIGGMLAGLFSGGLTRLPKQGMVVAGGRRLGELWLGAQANWFTEGGAAVIGGISCIIVVWLLLRWQPSFLKYDARNPVP